MNKKHLKLTALLIALIGLAIGGVLLYPVVHQRSQAACLTPTYDDVLIPAGTVTLGDSDGYYDERVRKTVKSDSFYIDRHEVTNAQFAEFVAATGYKTVAERIPDPNDYPGLAAEDLIAGSAVFTPPEKFYGPNVVNWWRFQPGADWRHPDGPGSSIDAREDWPVIHIAYADALAYATWKGRDLPTEAQWEYAARAGQDTRYSWGEDYAPAGKHYANTWQGAFPLLDLGDDGFRGIARVGCFKANPNGLYDMIGNVWEWTKDTYHPSRKTIPHAAPEARSPTHQLVIKGGSYLCAENYCLRYRPAARHPQETGLGTNHLGFRTVRNIGN